MKAIDYIDKKTIKKAYDLCMQGLAPFEIKEALGLNQNEWEYINRSGYYHSLLFMPSKQETIENNLDYIKGIELALFNAFEERSKCGVYSDRYAKFSKQINELQSIYSTYNVYENN